MRIRVLLLVSVLALAGCVGGGGSVETCTAKFTRADGSTSTVVTEVAGSITATNGICDGNYANEEELFQAVFETPPQQSLPTVAGVPQSVTTKTKGAMATETYTYGSPPAQKTVAAPPPQTSYRAAPTCRMTMVGGTGYACSAN